MKVGRFEHLTLTVADGGDGGVLHARAGHAARSHGPHKMSLIAGLCRHFSSVDGTRPATPHVVFGPNYALSGG